jgi:TRAP-type C4-dicarboxylate transport system substrate-binding protein
VAPEHEHGRDPARVQAAGGVRRPRQRTHQGQVKIQPYYGNALGIKEADVLRSIKAGSVEMSNAYAAYYGRDAPDLAVALPQGLVSSREQMIKVAPTLREIFDSHYRLWDGVPVAWSMGTIYDVSLFCKQPVGDLAALRTKKVRVWAKDQVDTFKRLGVAAEIIPQGELYLALQTGVVDCATYVAAVLKTLSLQEVTKYVSFLHIYSTIPNAVLAIKRHWNTLPKEIQDIILQEGEAQWQRTLQEAAGPDKSEAAAREELTQKFGMTFLPPFPDADRKALYDAASASWEERAKDVGRKAPAYRAKVWDAMKAAGDH